MNKLFGNLSAENRVIVENAMAEHDKHYRCLVSWVKHEMKRQGKRFKYGTGPGMISHLLSEGGTVATCIWEKYGGLDV
jgi:hypothetical protein